MEANPDVLKYADIAAGHGYNIPRIPYEFPIVPYDKAVDQGLKVWLTEISSALYNYDGSMDNAIHWAEVLINTCHECACQCCMLVDRSQIYRYK